MATVTTELVPVKTKEPPRWALALTAPVWLLPIWIVLALTLPGTPYSTINGYLIVVLLAVCSYTDIRWAKIRNSATYPTLLWALAINVLDALCRRHASDLADERTTSGFDVYHASQAEWWDALGAVGLGESLAGAVLAFVVMLFIYRMAGGGAGDVKLATALGALLGPAVPYAQVVDVIEDVVAAYVELRERPSETFLETVKRLGVEPFKERVYAAH